MTSASASVLRQVFESVGSNERLAVLIRAYFDESDDGVHGRGLLVVAGYVFLPSQMRKLEPLWRKMLVKYDIPYFHMSECNACDGIFAKSSDEECDLCARDAIKIARECTSHGVAYVMWQDEYREIFEDAGFDCDAYSFLLWTALIHVSKWRDANRPKSGLSLLFEDGYKTKSRANELLQIMSQDPRYKQDMRVTSHSFFNKDCSYHGQAADLLAWQVRKANSNQLAGKPIRKDTIALIEGRSTKTIFYDRAQLISIRDKFVAHSGSMASASRILFNPDGPLYFWE